MAVGAVLLALVIWYADPAVLSSKLSRADPRLVVLAVVLASTANSLSALRWSVIARGLGLLAPSAKLVVIYARGITTNMLLPGATLSGDLLRSVQLSRLGNPFVASALSVFLDRFSGLWVLCMLSLVAAASVTLWSVLGRRAPVAPNQMSVYLLILGGIALVPFVPLPFGWLERSNVAWIAALASRWERLRGRLRQARPALLGVGVAVFGRAAPVRLHAVDMRTGPGRFPVLSRDAGRGGADLHHGGLPIGGGWFRDARAGGSGGTGVGGRPERSRCRNVAAVWSHGGSAGDSCCPAVLGSPLTGGLPKWAGIASRLGDAYFESRLF